MANETEFMEEQRLIRNIKNHLRFNAGDIVFFKTDSARKNPMVIKSCCDLGIDSGDYVCTWFNSQRCLQTEFFHDSALIPDDRIDLFPLNF
jgi:uncharacterized protein YodC (DUF2158 family)